MILQDVTACLREYARSPKGPDYEKAARGIYRARQVTDPFSPSFVGHIVAGLEAFDMRRVMYDRGRGIHRQAVTAKLRSGLPTLRQLLSPLVDARLGEVDPGTYRYEIRSYQRCRITATWGDFC